jgi:hypothetical protein
VHVYIAPICPIVFLILIIYGANGKIKENPLKNIQILTGCMKKEMWSRRIL